MDKQELINEISIWRKYKTEVWYKKNDTRSEIIHDIARIVRGMPCSKGVGYLSTPITSGKQLYIMMQERGLKEHDKKVMADNIKINEEKGIEKIHDMMKYIDIPIIYPGAFFPVNGYDSYSKWETPQFMALWLTLIGENATALFMNDDWEYSNGCAEEFTHAVQMKLGYPTHPNILFSNPIESIAFDSRRQISRLEKIKIYEAKLVPGGIISNHDAAKNLDGTIISAQEGMEKISNAIKDIRQMGFNPTNLEETLRILEKTIKQLLDS